EPIVDAHDLPAPVALGRSSRPKRNCSVTTRTTAPPTPRPPSPPSSSCPPDCGVHVPGVTLLGYEVCGTARLRPEIPRAGPPTVTAAPTSGSTLPGIATAPMTPS